MRERRRERRRERPAFVGLPATLAFSYFWRVFQVISEFHHNFYNKPCKSEDKETETIGLIKWKEMVLKNFKKTKNEKERERKRERTCNLGRRFMKHVPTLDAATSQDCTLND